MHNGTYAHAVSNNQGGMLTSKSRLLKNCLKKTMCGTGNCTGDRQSSSERKINDTKSKHQKTIWVVRQRSSSSLYTRKEAICPKYSSTNQLRGTNCLKLC